MQTNVNSRTLKLVKMALMIAVAVIFSFIHFPILPAAPFLEFEVSDIPILIAAFAFGPIPGLVVALISILLHDLLMGPASGPYGMIMHIIAAAVLVLISGFLYQKFKSKKGAIISLIVGGLCMAGVMVPANLVVTPLFMGLPVSAVIPMLPTVIIPFNLIKVAILCVVVFYLYKGISPILHGVKAAPETKKREPLGAAVIRTIIGVGLVVYFAYLVFALSGGATLTKDTIGVITILVAGIVIIITGVVSLVKRKK
ncbi:hypothetical protein AGMMS49983_17300 [Clostridia bacterium]|nr:hypothetical protein AGMMS49983_17300 [Clostridia bacterium]